MAATRSIAAGLGEAELISIPTVMAGRINAAAPKIGLVFPVYAWGLPRIVADFVKKLKLNKEQYVFAVATSGGTPAGTLRQLQKMLQQSGADWAAGFVVKKTFGSLGMVKNVTIILK